MHEMTTSDMLRDPLIRLMLRADKISLASFAILLDTAARRQTRDAGTHRAAAAHHSVENVPVGPAVTDVRSREALSPV
ncbi:hypothetical protein ACC817_05600 [Rhizobium ruizarguesonis]|uniref:hypothetical protein n=1 Tax=Rhizobium ruizarguesonis TaxID=2081791 RepID=UPI001031DBE3|nr:hypothetical protein [Rhizobium ruizarguesonis]TAY73161.1 hypothetical protein ELH84_04360 [Rhizobium ruizarguesonis]